MEKQEGSTGEWGWVERLKRRKWYKYPFLAPRLQFHLSLLLVTVAVVNVVYVTLLFHFYSRNRLLPLMEKLSGNTFLSDLVEEHMFKLMTNIFIVGSLEMVVILALGLFFTHRVAGPLYAMNLRVKEIIDGRVPSPIHFRSTDLLREFTIDMNRMIGTLKERESELENAVKDAEAGRLDLVKERLRKLTAN